MRDDVFFRSDRNSWEERMGGRVDIITRTKNRPILLVRAFASVLAQTYTNWHLYLVNDGGDRLQIEELVHQYQTAFGGRIAVIHHPASLGMEAASNTGLRAGSGDYFVIHDDDDAWHPEFLERTVGFLRDAKNSRYVAVATNCEVVHERIDAQETIEIRREPWVMWKSTVDLSDQLSWNRFPPICLLIRRSVTESIGYYNDALPVLGDWDYNLRLLRLGDIGTIQDPLAYYYNRDSSRVADIYGNSVHSGVDKHVLYQTLYRNSILRNLIASRPEFVGLLHVLLRRDDALDARIGQAEGGIRWELAETRRALERPWDCFSVYYAPPGAEFSEEQCSRCTYTWADVEATLELALPVVGRGYRLRIDPSQRPGLFAMYSIEVDGQELADLPSRVRGINQRLVSLPVAAAGAICLFSLDSDPYIELDVGDVVFGSGALATTRVRVRCQRIADAQATTVMLLERQSREAELLRELTEWKGREDAAQREVAEWKKKEAAAQRELASIQSSTLWHAVSRLRRAATHLPMSVRIALRRAVKGVWWVITPWRIPQRLRLRRERRGASSGRQRSSNAAKQSEGTDDVPLADYEYTVPEFDATRIDSAIRGMTARPRFSIVVPVYDTDPVLLRQAIASVQAQWYPDWELVLVDDHSLSPAVGEVLGEVHDPRMVVIRLPQNRRISGATNAGLARATGDYVVFLDHDDELTPDCLYELALCIDRENPDYVYSDEDKLDADGTLRDPFFKPDWSPDTMMSIMLTCHVSCVRRSLADEVGGLRNAYDGSQDWDFVLRVTERTSRIAHISKVLYHWRIIPASCASDLQAKPYAIDASKRAREGALRRRGLAGELVPVPELPGYFRTHYFLRGNPLFSIIVPTKDNGRVLKVCIDSIFEKTSYRNFEIIVVNNGSADRDTLSYLDQLHSREHVTVLDHDVPFNYSEINNYAVRHARGDVLVFLNDDTEVISADWLDHMGGYAQLPHVGAVGAKLLYPGAEFVQHVGVINIAPGPVHAFARMPAHAPGYFVRNMLEYDWVAVTGACMMVERAKFDACGGFDEDLAVAYNDVALCFSMAERGLYNVVCPGVELIHHESLTRGNDIKDAAKLARLNQERDLAFLKHPGFRGRDPFYNPNLDANDANFRLRFGSSAFIACDSSKFVLSRRSSSGRCSLDVLDREPQVYGVSEAAGPMATFTGWASNARGAEAGVFALVLKGDAGFYYAWTRTGIARPDVAEASGLDALSTSGFSLTTSLAHVAPGSYGIYVVNPRMPDASCRFPQALTVP